MDYPYVRANAFCQLCGGEKETGTLVCWSCYRAKEMRYGNAEAEIIIEQAEDRMMKQDSNRSGIQQAGR